MATAPAALPFVDDHLWRMSVERYHEAIRAGVLTGDDRVELLEGVLVEKMSKYPRHSFVCDALSDCILLLRLTGWYRRSEQPLTLADSEPEPDLALVRGSRADYLTRHPGPGETGLVVEVADSTLSRDRGKKRRIYARAGIPCYWLVNLNARTLEVYTSPAGDDYEKVTILTEGESVTLELDGQACGQIALRDILPPIA